MRVRMSDAPRLRLGGSVAAHPQTGLHMMEVFSSGHEIELEDRESVSVMMPHRGHIEVRHETRMQAASADGVVTIGPSQRVTKVFPVGDRLFDGCLLKIPVLHPSVRELLGRGNNEYDPFLRANEEAVPALTELVSYVLTDLASEAPVLTTDRAALLLDALVDEHIRRVLEPEPPGLKEECDGNEARLVCCANEYMRANFHEPLRISDIAMAAGVGARQLQAAFKAVTGRTPWDHLTAIRLEQARHCLLENTKKSSVSGIALDCGFTHLGRFSTLYRATYNEAPSETLRLSRL